MLLNVEGDDENLSKTKAFCDSCGMQSPAEARPTYIHGAFVGDEPNAFKQFQMEYIPHGCVPSSSGVFLAKRVQPDQAIAMASGAATA